VIKPSNDLGPASYDLPSFVGPSAIGLSTIKSSPQFTLKDRLTIDHRLKASREVPGPGAYPTINILGKSVLSTVSSPPSWGMKPIGESSDPSSPSSSYRPNTSSHFEMPSPATYSPNSSFCEPALPSYSLGKRTPSIIRTNSTGPNLGPGAYDIQSSTGIGSSGFVGTRASSPSFSLRPRVNDPISSSKMRNPSPAPNEYTLPSGIGPSYIYNSNGAFSVRGRTLEPRKNPAKETPGPNEYSLHSLVGGRQSSSTVLTTPSWGFGFGDRPNQRGPSTPGPGTYNVPTSFRTLSPSSPFGITLKGRLLQGTPEAAAKRNPSPGPAAFGQLDVSVLGNYPSLRTPGLSMSPRMTRTRSQLEAAAGPKSILKIVDMNVCRTAAPSYTMKGRIETKFKDASSLGPAAYNLQGSGFKSPQRRNTPSWTLKARWSSKVKDNGIPGPGAYGEFVLPFYEMKMNSRAGSRSPSPLPSRSSSPFSSPGISPQTSIYSIDNSLNENEPHRLDRISKGPGIANLIGGFGFNG
jgi:hypothetical protein